MFLSYCFPVVLLVLSLGVWFFQQLAQRAWDHYEWKRRAYLEFVSLIDALFEGGDATNKPAYMKAVRSVWLAGSDDVIRAMRALHDSSKAKQGYARDAELYPEVINTMRKNLHCRSYLPPSESRCPRNIFR